MHDKGDDSPVAERGRDRGSAPGRYSNPSLDADRSPDGRGFWSSLIHPSCTVPVRHLLTERASIAARMPPKQKHVRGLIAARDTRKASSAPRLVMSILCSSACSEAPSRPRRCGPGPRCDVRPLRRHGRGTPVAVHWIRPTASRAARIAARSRCSHCASVSKLTPRIPTTHRMNCHAQSVAPCAMADSISVTSRYPAIECRHTRHQIPRYATIRP